MAEKSWLEALRCPDCRESLAPTGGALNCSRCKRDYPLEDGIPRFVPVDNYAASFGFQWNQHRATQLDSRSGTTVSRDRLLRESGWILADLRGTTILECGSGAGRFTEVLCQTGAEVTSVDFSSAVRANAASNGRFDNLRLVQASIYQLPFEPESFDYLLCIGVIQHTPDVEKAFKSMFRFLRRGGRFCIDVYASPMSYLHPRHLLRAVTKRIPPQRLYPLVERAVPKLLPLSTLLLQVPIAGEYLARAIPVANWRKRDTALLSQPELEALAVLDTFDWLSPRYDSPQRRGRLRQWVSDLGLRECKIERIHGLYVLRGTK
jgi:ubiquinone/menaquinone biosynthesis C-methylase UbiE/uncharacterized protein YbaR (Trm112 family)